MVALGSTELMKGFALIGFETIHDASVDDLKKTVDRLTKQCHRALLFVEHYLANEGRHILNPVMDEGGGIIIVEIPPITNPEALISVVSEKVTHRLGKNVLEESA